MAAADAHAARDAHSVNTQDTRVVDSEGLDALQRFKLKRLIHTLDAAQGADTSVISLGLPPGTQVALVSKKLTAELGAAANIKSSANRHAVQTAISAASARLKTYAVVPRNGLVIFAGEVLTEEGKPRKLTLDLEPPLPLQRSVYWCGSRFRTECLVELLADEGTYGFIVVDGGGCLLGTLTGSRRRVLQHFSVDLPKKHGRGGQSALRFARLRLEKRHNYVRKVAEAAATAFIGSDSRLTVAGLVLAGSAEFKTQLQTSDLFDRQLADAVVAVVDVAYGGDNGFAQAVQLAGGALANVKFVAEQALLKRFFSEIAKDTGRYAFGVRDTLRALEASAVDTLIVYEDLPDRRFQLRNPGTGEEHVLHSQPGKTQRSVFQDRHTDQDLEVVSSTPLVEWLADNAAGFGARLSFVTESSQEGSQFLRGFGGLGALLRWSVDFGQLEEQMHGVDTDALQDTDEVSDDDDFM